MIKTITGVVTSDKPDKTIVVSVHTRKTHPLYKKQYTVTKRFMAHDEKNEARVGDKVVISETRPLSARKRHILSKIIERSTLQAEQMVETVTPEPELPKKEVREVVKTKVTQAKNAKQKSVAKEIISTEEKQ